MTDEPSETVGPSDDILRAMDAVMAAEGVRTVQQIPPDQIEGMWADVVQRGVEPDLGDDGPPLPQDFKDMLGQATLLNHPEPTTAQVREETIAQALVGIEIAMKVLAREAISIREMLGLVHGLKVKPRDDE